MSAFSRLMKWFLLIAGRIGLAIFLMQLLLQGHIAWPRVGLPPLGGPPPGLPPPRGPLPPVALLSIEFLLVLLACWMEDVRLTRRGHGFLRRVLLITLCGAALGASRAGNGPIPFH